MGDDTDQPRGGAWEPQEDREPEAARNRPLASQHLGVDALNDYLDGGLTAADRAVATAHLATCDDCRRELAELRATVALVRGLPQYAARRSFQLGLEYARSAARPGGWVARLLPALPALRAATVAVAVLLVAVTAGDFVSNRGSQQREQPSLRSLPADEAFPVDTSNRGPTPVPSLIQAPAAAPATDEEAAGGFGTESTAPSSQTMEDGAELAEPQAPPQAAGQAIDAEMAESTGPGLAASPRPAATAPSASLGGRAVPAPTAPAGGAEAGSGGEVAPAERTGPSGWRLAQVGLGLLLLWLIVGLVGMERLQRRG